MSVLKTKRNQSAIEYVATAYKIYKETIRFLTKLSARYSRLIAEPIAKLASEVIDNCEKANNIYPSDQKRKDLRETHLLEARASLSALDVHLSMAYEIMIENPQGCFTNKSGETIPSAKAQEKLDHMSQSIGELIEFETALLTGVLKSDKGR